MGRKPRFDEPGAWHHVMNRAIARRTFFESDQDIRFFLSRVAREVRAGRLEVHAFCVMTTHFHLLVRSPVGELSQALQTIQNEYVRQFNRRRRRDGSLVRGRFLSRPVRSECYGRILVRYIDDNPVAAGLVAAACLYPHGSARHHVAGSGPPWLERSWVQQCLQQAASRPDGPPCSYLDFFGDPPTPGLRRLIERRLRAAPHCEDPLDQLFDAAAADVRSWMRRKAALADGTKPGAVLVDPGSVQEVLGSREVLAGTWKLRLGRKSVDAWEVVRTGLLRDLCGTSLAEAARRSGRSIQSASELYRRHRRAMLQDEGYAARVAELAREVLSACHAPRRGANR